MLGPLTMKPSRLFITAGLTAALLGAVACNSTTLQSSWKAPEAGSIHFTKVLVIATAPVGSLRRLAEDTMKAQITGVPAVASYEFLPTLDDLKDRAKVAQAITSSGVDGIVVMRIVSDQNVDTYNPGGPIPAYYGSFWGYYARPYAMQPMYWEPGSVTTDRVVGIETNIYNAKDASLIWSGVTKTTNPDQMEKFIPEVAAVVRAKLRRQQLIP
jgi:hypothetical protein